MRYLMRRPTLRGSIPLSLSLVKSGSVQASRKPHPTSMLSAWPRWPLSANWGRQNTHSGSASSTGSTSPIYCGVRIQFTGGFLVRKWMKRRRTMTMTMKRTRRSFQVRGPHVYHTLCMQLTTSDIADEAQSQPSEHTSEGVPPAHMDVPSVPPLPERAGDVRDVVPMDQDIDGGETPRRPRAGKRAIVLSPSSDRGVPLAQRQRRSSSARPPVCIHCMPN